MGINQHSSCEVLGWSHSLSPRPTSLFIRYTERRVRLSGGEIGKNPHALPPPQILQRAKEASPENETRWSGGYRIKLELGDLHSSPSSATEFLCDLTQVT